MSDERITIVEEKFVRTEIIEERGRWVVYLEIGDSETSIRHRINDYHKPNLAELAAKWIKRTAEKEQVFAFEKEYVGLCFVKHVLFQ